MNIVIGFSRAKSVWKIGSKFIAESEKRNYSHAYIKIVDSFTGVTLVYQASLGMVNCYNYELFLEHNIVAEEYILDITKEQSLDILTFLHKNLGKPYSKIQILLLGLKKLLRFEVKYKNNDQSFICSELVLRVLQITRPKLVVSNIDYKTPSDLNKLLNDLQIQRVL